MTVAPSSSVPSRTSWRPGEVLRHPSFWGLLGVYTSTWIPVFLPLVHLVPLAQDLGLGRAAGATIISALGIGAFIAMLFLFFAFHLLAEQPSLSPMDAAKGSVDLVQNNIMDTLIVLAINAALGTVLSALVVTSVVALPLCTVLNTLLFMRLRGYTLPSTAA